MARKSPIINQGSLDRLREKPLEATWEYCIIHIANKIQPVVLKPGMFYNATSEGLLTISTDNQTLPWDDSEKGDLGLFQLELILHIDDISRIEFYRKNLIETPVGRIITN